LLDLIVERLHALPVLLIVTFRPEFQAPWRGQPQVTDLALGPLDRRDRAALAAQVAGDKSLPDEVIAQIVDRICQARSPSRQRAQIAKLSIAP